MTLRTGFIGLGAMGAPMARNLARAGLLTAVWNRTPAKAAELAKELDVTVAADPADLAHRCDAVCLCVSADADVLETIDALLPGLRPGTVVIDHSTVSSETARLAAAKIRAVGGDFLDAPVSGGVEGARAGTLAVMVGGEANTLEKARPVLEAVGGRIAHMGDVGAGQATKAVNQVLCAGINQAVCEALAFGRALGLNLDKVIDVISKGAAGNWFLEKRGPTMIQGSFEPGFKLSLHHKDLQICREMARHRGAEVPLVEKTLADYRRLMAEGHGEEDISALLRLWYQPDGNCQKN
ncbi:3-hydroxyisobutyrate dehydrogenase [Methylomarinovum tepidoasis]|uniref:3-hydroxyisobutyrate dehydrogenase n=1 Tax=Methylomarinovum tepidoasis TaxID=2840183 RepID=A0AAU9CYW4_9GAMM|nr:3-hydroxyisobutyrate dehydrogenase [Methylomarinovum sp. IN45]